jgi:hypothetical protein
MDSAKPAVASVPFQSELAENTLVDQHAQLWDIAVKAEFAQRAHQQLKSLQVTLNALATHHQLAS